jgi:hypothetical protein
LVYRAVHASGLFGRQVGKRAGNRLGSPGSIELILQAIFVSEAIEGGACRMLRGWQHSPQGAIAVGGACASAENTIIAVLPQDLEAILLSAETSGWVQLVSLPIKPATGVGLRSHCFASALRSSLNSEFATRKEVWR